MVRFDPGHRVRRYIDEDRCVCPADRLVRRLPTCARSKFPIPRATHSVVHDPTRSSRWSVRRGARSHEVVANLGNNRQTGALPDCRMPKISNSAVSMRAKSASHLPTLFGESDRAQR